jgi:hypothetical protein
VPGVRLELQRPIAQAGGALPLQKRVSLLLIAPLRSAHTALRVSVARRVVAGGSGKTFEPFTVANLAREEQNAAAAKSTAAWLASLIPIPEAPARL